MRKIRVNKKYIDQLLDIYITTNIMKIKIVVCFITLVIIMIAIAILFATDVISVSKSSTLASSVVNSTFNSVGGRLFS